MQYDLLVPFVGIFYPRYTLSLYSTFNNSAFFNSQRVVDGSLGAFLRGQHDYDVVIPVVDDCYTQYTLST